MTDIQKLTLCSTLVTTKHRHSFNEIIIFLRTAFVIMKKGPYYAILKTPNLVLEN